MQKHLFLSASFLALCFTVQAQWSLSGNSNASSSSKLGTTNSAPVRIVTNNAERMRIDSNGQVSIGLATSFARLTAWNNGSTPASVWKTGTRSVFMGFGENTSGSSDLLLSMASNTAGSRPVFIGRRSRGTLVAPTTVAQNDLLVSVLSSAYDGKTFQNAATIDFVVDGTAAAGKVPTKLSFVTGASTSTRKERMRIGSNGDVAINNQALFSTSSTGQSTVNLNNGQLRFTTKGRGIEDQLLGDTVSVVTSRFKITDLPNNDVGNDAALFNIDARRANGINVSGGGIGINVFGEVTGMKVGGVDLGMEVNNGMIVNNHNNSGIGMTIEAEEEGINITTAVRSLGMRIKSHGSGIFMENYGTSLYTKSLRNGIFSITGGQNEIDGEPDNSYGVYGENGANIGVAGIGEAVGVYGYSNASHGVYGTTAATGAYAGYFTGRVFGSGGFFTTSDSKLKKGIKDIPTGLDIIRKLKPRTYEYRQEGDFKLMNLPTGKHYGLLAQELEQVLPNLVKTSKFEPHIAQKPGTPDTLKTSTQTQREAPIEFKAVNYIELIPIMVKAMQEQQQENEALKNMVERQQQQIDELKTMVNKVVQGSSAVSLNNASIGLITPNPFKGSASIRYSIPDGSVGQLLVSDAAGRQVKSMSLKGGGTLNLDASPLASGVYNYSLIVNGKKVQTEKMTVLR